MNVADYYWKKGAAMYANESLADRWVRVVLGVLLGMTVIFKIAAGTLAIVAGISAGIAVITGVAGFCSIYALFGHSSCKEVHSRATP
jgi:Protein of unknown function (DUF2892)